jgi:hypothetical protein
MNAFINENQNLIIAIVGVFSFAVLAFQIWRGEAQDAFANENSVSRTFSRKTEPRQFWLSIVVQTVIAVGAIVLFLYLFN